MTQVLSRDSAGGEWHASLAFSEGRAARGGRTPSHGLALPGCAGEFAKKRCANAQLAKRRRLGWVAALPPTSTRPGASRLEATRAFSRGERPVTRLVTRLLIRLVTRPLTVILSLLSSFVRGLVMGL